MEKVSFAYVEKSSNYKQLQLGSQMAQLNPRSGLNKLWGKMIHNYKLSFKQYYSLYFHATIYKQASLIPCIHKFQS